MRLQYKIKSFKKEKRRNLDTDVLTGRLSWEGWSYAATSLVTTRGQKTLLLVPPEGAQPYGQPWSRLSSLQKYKTKKKSYCLSFSVCDALYHSPGKLYTVWEQLLITCKWRVQLCPNKRLFTQNSLAHGTLVCQHHFNFQNIMMPCKPFYQWLSFLISSHT